MHPFLRTLSRRPSAALRLNDGWLAHFFAVVPVLIAGATAAAQPTRLWIEQFGTNNPDKAYALMADGAGGVIVAGETGGDLGGPNAGGMDVFLAGYDGAGNQLWVGQFGTAESDHPAAITTDGAGGMFVAGSIDLLEAFLARCDGGGQLLWLRKLGNDKRTNAWAVAPDGEGGAFIAGQTGGDLGGPNVGEDDVFIARYDSAGNQLWIKQIGSLDFDWGTALTPDGAGGVILTGWSRFNLGGPHDGGRETFVAKYDGAGNQIWITQFGTPGEYGGEFPTATIADGAGGVIIVGYTNGPGGWDWDAYLAQCDGSGNLVWFEQFGTALDDFAWDLAPDGEGGVFIAGSTDGGFGCAQGWYDAFLAHCDAHGNQRGVTQFGTHDNDEAFAVASDSQGGAFIAGYTAGNLGDPGADGTVFLARYADSCVSDCDGNGTLDVFDYLCFINLFIAGDDGANCDDSCGLDLFDFLCFVNAFNAGC